MRTNAMHQQALIFILACFGILSFTVCVEAQDISAELNPTTFGVDQAATLQVTVNGARSADIALPEVDGVVFYPNGTNSQIQIVNGAVTSSVIYSYAVQANSPGSYTIGPISVVVENKAHETAPISFTVTPAGSPPGGTSRNQPNTAPPPSAAEDNSSFIAFVPQKNQAYLGEVVPAQIKVYFRKGVRINQVSLPKFSGDAVLLDPLGNDPLQGEETVDGVRYNVLSWQSFVTGIKEGNHQLSFIVDATQLVRARRSSAPPGFGSGFFDDDLFNNFFSDYSSRPLQLTSTPVKFQVKPLPAAGRPEDFSGAVGRFDLQVQAQPQEVEPGEPITLAMTVSGSGNFDRIKAPFIGDNEGIKSYPPTAAFAQDRHPHQGTKRFEQAVVITDPARRQIPPVIFSYFDPDEKRYRTLFSDPIGITLNAPALASAAPTAGPPPAAAPAAGPDPVNFSQNPLPAPVKLTGGRAVHSIRPLFLAPWFIAALLILLTGSAGLSGYRIYHGLRSKQPGIIHKKKLAKQKKITLAALNNLDIGRNSYPTEAQEALRPFLATLLQTEAASLSTADVIHKTGEDSAVSALFTLCDQCRYGGLRTPESDRNRLQRALIEYVAGAS